MVKKNYNVYNDDNDDNDYNVDNDDNDDNDDNYDSDVNEDNDDNMANEDIGDIDRFVHYLGVNLFIKTDPKHLTQFAFLHHVAQKKSQLALKLICFQTCS